MPGESIGEKMVVSIFNDDFFNLAQVCKVLEKRYERIEHEVSFQQLE